MYLSVVGFIFLWLEVDLIFYSNRNWRWFIGFLLYFEIGNSDGNGVIKLYESYVIEVLIMKCYF